MLAPLSAVLRRLGAIPVPVLILTFFIFLLVIGARTVSQEKLHNVTSPPPVVFDQIICIGDSLTAGLSTEKNLVNALARNYHRTFDVLNRGWAGYNSAWTRITLPQWFPRTGAGHVTPRLVLLWLGSNDAAGALGAVTIPQFKANIKAIIKLLKSPNSPNYSPRAEILLLTATPFDPSVSATFLRTLSRTKLYAEAMKDVGKELALPVVDLYGAIESRAREGVPGGGREVWDKWFTDGLHLSEKGYEVVVEKVGEAIEQHFPELHWNNVAKLLPMTPVDEEDELLRESRNLGYDEEGGAS
ncbi:GDSL Lipase/Acylhydrolase family protein [Pseudohyphozyma bogoriensis]|nr:GDSL Lipase/Acylhydrolase family protein [Pseudohyphozyma bogoriensis]